MTTTGNEMKHFEYEASEFMALRKIYDVSDSTSNRSAIVFRDAEWDEYRVKFFSNGGIPLCSSADYHTNDMGDAKGTANHWIHDYKQALGRNETL